MSSLSLTSDLSVITLWRLTSVFVLSSSSLCYCSLLKKLKSGAKFKNLFSYSSVLFFHFYTHSTVFLSQAFYSKCRIIECLKMSQPCGNTGSANTMTQLMNSSPFWQDSYPDMLSPTCMRSIKATAHVCSSVQCKSVHVGWPECLDISSNSCG